MNQQTQRAKELRKHMTDAEQLLWHHLRRKQIHGLRFRRQHPIGPYVVDFVCLPARLIVELNGGQHVENIAYDARRDNWLRAQGYKILRFWNNQVFQETEAVLTQIHNEAGFPPSPPGRGPGGGEQP
jgi:very-short-patch-repair endonuclease